MRRISEILQDKRIEMGYSLDQVVKDIKIRKRFLISIESGNYFELPSETYALGFIKNYATYLGIDKNKAGALFRREFEGGNGKIMPTFKSQDKKLRKKIIFTPRNIIIGIVVIVVLGYIVFQYSSYFLGPRLMVKSPADNFVIRDNIVQVEGNTEPYASVLINNDEAYVNLDGSFKKTLYLFPGKRQITIESKNRNGKSTRKIINVNVR